MCPASSFSLLGVEVKVTQGAVELLICGMRLQMAW